MPYTPKNQPSNLAATKAEADEAKREEALKDVERKSTTAARFEHG